LDERATYTSDRPYGTQISEAIDTFMLTTYAPYEPGRTEEAFFWHGLMGYTKSGIRLIGPEPRNPILLYNLGCNGIGLLPSIFGGSKIAARVRGTPQEPSIFDPKG
jgi:glycine/D-amino acid oxidase-like deaminating enzyme